MKKGINCAALLLVGALAVAGCGIGAGKDVAKQPEAQQTEARQETEVKTSVETEQTESETEAASEAEAQAAEGAAEFSFADVATQEFYFSSGAGAWATTLGIRADGTFLGYYSDSDMGDTGPGYPNGTVYWCRFTGRFSQPVRIDDYTYSMQVEELQYEEAEAEKIGDDGIRYILLEAYGIAGAKEVRLYLPGRPIEGLSEEFMSWVRMAIPDEAAALPFYALHNEAQEYGFFSYDLVESARDTVRYAEETTTSLEYSIGHDPLTQQELTEKATEMYRQWDVALNQIWDVLKRVKDPAEMEALTKEEREWIKMKEQAVLEAGSGAEGGTAQPMLESLRGAELTKERVYFLLGLL